MDKPRITEGTPFPNNYVQNVLEIGRGRGVFVYDTGGKRYLDLGAGIAVNAFGYGDRRLARAAYRQMKRVVHTSNLYATRPSIDYARDLIAAADGYGRTPFAAVHFGNSGTEANEAAIKYARLTARAERASTAYYIISFENAFHGRTMGALAATPNRKYREKFEPLPAGFRSLPFNDPAALKTLDPRDVAAIIVEVVQGEGGLSQLTPETAKVLNEFTARHGILLIADEVQTGFGRTGHLFASRAVGLTPDIMTLSKPIAGGLPLSATLIPDRVNDRLSVGDHGTTFGGGPVTCAVAREILRRVSSAQFLEGVRERAERLDDALRSIVQRVTPAVDVRGVGMLRGLVLDFGDKTDALFPAVIEEARARGVLVLRSGGNVLRIAPPLIISAGELERGVSIVESSIETVFQRREA